MDNKILNKDSVLYKNTTLKSQVDSNNVSHAYLFCGPQGSPKLVAAYELAAFITNPDKLDDIKQEKYPDVVLCKPQGAHGYLSDQIKNIISDSLLAPIYNMHKVFIIEQADKLSTSCANSFLKTLEEPSRYAKFILLCNDINNVLTTIVSRCQTIEFTNLKYQDAFDIVKQKSQCSDNIINYSLELYNMDIKNALNYCNDFNLHDLNNEILSLLNNIDNFNYWETLERTKDINNKIDEITNVHKKKLELQTHDLISNETSINTKQIEEFNKRNILSKKSSLMYMFCNCIKLFLKNQISKNINNEKLVNKLIKCNKKLACYETYLEYNINYHNFCDVVMLQIKQLLVQ